MKRFLLIPFLLMSLTLAGFAASASGAAAPGRAQPLTVEAPGTGLVAGNYCTSCHLADDPRLSSATEWKGGIAREANSPCPAATAIHKELYYTERMLLMINRARGPARGIPEKLQAQLEGYTQAYSRQLDQPVTSLEAFTSEAQSTRYRLNKVYAALNQAIEADKKTGILVFSIAASLVVLGSLVWGWLNTRSFGGGPARRPKSLIAAALFLVAVAAFFALPIFRIPAVVTASPTTEQQEAQAVMDEADRAASGADRAQARAWMLAQVAGQWNEGSPAQADVVLDEARAALQEAQENENALWGESLAVQEANIASSIQLEKARLIALDLNAARSRQWSLPLIAAEWAEVDSRSAAALLQAEQDPLASAGGMYRDLQLRAVALAWLRVEPSKAVPCAMGIEDPGIRSWTLREIGNLEKDPSAYAAAGDAARQVVDPVQRARALRELALASGETELFNEALAALKDVTGEPLAYALSDLAAASQDPSLVELVDPAFPEARTAALLYGGDHQAALEASSGIEDPIEQARARAAIAGAWGSEEAARRIGMQPYRDLAMRDVIRKTGDVSLTGLIISAYYKVEALTALHDMQTALQEAEKLKDSYPLIALGELLAKDDPQQALRLVDMMSREADKAAVLRAIAVESGDAAIFEQAQAMALAARVRGDALAPARASLELAQALWSLQPVNAQSALRQAHEAARRITIK